ALSTPFPYTTLFRSLLSDPSLATIPLDVVADRDRPGHRRRLAARPGRGAVTDRDVLAVAEAPSSARLGDAHVHPLAVGDEPLRPGRDLLGVGRCAVAGEGRDAVGHERHPQHDDRHDRAPAA